MMLHTGLNAGNITAKSVNAVMLSLLTEIDVRLWCGKELSRYARGIAEAFNGYIIEYVEERGFYEYYYVDDNILMVVGADDNLINKLKIYLDEGEGEGPPADFIMQDISRGVIEPDSEVLQ